jgi:hypothetical protein
MHYGARFYSPRLGRFVSADSIVPQPGEPQALNRYSYVYNNPVIYTDPSGHCIPGVDCPGDLPEPDWRPSTDPHSMGQEEYIGYLLWAGVYFEREEAETGGTVGLSLSRDNLNFELGTALAKYAAQGGEASWQAAIGGDPFIVYAVAQFGSQLGEDAYLALGQAYQSRAAQSIGGRIGGAGQIPDDAFVSIQGAGFRQDNAAKGLRSNVMSSKKIWLGKWRDFKNVTVSEADYRFKIEGRWDAADQAGGLDAYVITRPGFKPTYAGDPRPPGSGTAQWTYEGTIGPQDFQIFHIK